MDKLEIYKTIKGYEGKYEVSNFGNIRSLLSNKILKKRKAKNGYLRIVLYDDNTKPRSFLIHRLVGSAFLAKTEGKDYIDHINGNKTDNRVENLRWCTQRENLLFSDKVRELRKNIKGENHPMYGKHNNSKAYLRAREAQKICVLQYKKDGTFVAEWNGIIDASKAVARANASRITQCCKGKALSAGGYVWKYKL